MNLSRSGQTSACAPNPAIFAGLLSILPRSRAGALATLAALTVAVNQAHGATWNADTDGNWGTGSWTGGPPNNQNLLADFSTVSITADRTITLDTNFTIGDLKFGNAAATNFNWTLSTSNGSSLNLRNTGTGGVAEINVVNQTATISVVLTSQNTSSVNKLGTGILILTAANAYELPTTVTQGTLLANNATGSATSAGTVTVNSGATLGGSGTIAPGAANNISVSGVLAPGAAVGSIGNLTFNMTGAGTATMASGATFAFDLGLAGTDISSVGSSDMLSLTGAATGDFVFNGNSINAQGTGTDGFYKLFDTDSNNASTWSGLIFDGTTGVISSGLSVTNLASGKTGTLLVGTGSNGGSVGDIYLSVVPEPSAALLAGLGSCFLFRRRRIPS